MREVMSACVLLENGATFPGIWRGHDGEPPVGEACFNTSMTGYQEILTDPSYAGQVITMTYPLIGNYGVNRTDLESNSVHAVGFVVRELSEIDSNFESEGGIESFLKEHQIPCMTEVDTRALTRAIRDAGAMRCTFMREGESKEEALKRIQDYDYGSIDYTEKVAEKNATIQDEPRASKDAPRVAVLDFGIKRNILKLLSDFCRPRVYTVDEFNGLDLDEEDFDGYFLSNGPGNPEAVKPAIEAIQRILKIGKPVFGICLGHQLLGLALGGKTYKLKFGHRGANHPIKNLKTEDVEIASHNHGYALDGDSLPEGVEVTHINLNDKTVAGIRVKGKPVFSVQYHPEASPGPHDPYYLFTDFKKALLETAD